MDGIRMVRSGLVMLCALATALPAGAQWVTQTVTLRPGWNAVFLEVEPAPAQTATQLDGIPVESVWAWNKRFSSVQYIQDPNTLAPQQPEWLKYFPEGTPNAFLTNLRILLGGRAYLIKLGGQQEVTWSVTGQPVYRPGAWVADSFNLSGFYVAAGSGMTFQTYFAPSPAHAGQRMMKLDSAGTWVTINPAQDTIVRGEAYWVYTSGESTYQGPASVDADDGPRLDYGRSLNELDLVLRNASGTSKVFTFSPQLSATPPAGEGPLLAGDVPLSWYQLDLANNLVEWTPLGAGTTFTVPGNSERTLRVAVRRTDFADFVPPAENLDFLYQSLLEVTDSAGFSVALPVTAAGLQTLRPDAAAKAARGEKQTLEQLFGNPNAGLWYGYVSIDKVSEPNNASQGPVVPLQTMSDFVFPVVVHVDYDGNAKLLSHATVMWKDGLTQPAQGNPNLVETAEAGRYVVVSNDALLNQFQGSMVNDGTPVGRRFASANFSHRTPQALTGEFGGMLGTTLTLPYNDTLNPFKHAFHPDHNMAVAVPTTRADGSASQWYTVTREISLEFTGTDPESVESTRWGDQLAGGYWRETLIGIHSKLIYTEGFFRLSRVLDVGVLNDGIE